MKPENRVALVILLSMPFLIAASCESGLEDAVRPDGPTMDEVFEQPEPNEPDPVDPETTICDDFDFASYQSHCGEMSLSSTDLSAGDILTVTVNLTCGGARLACDYAEQGLTEVDGDQVDESAAGFPQPYNYDPPRPIARRNGSIVDLTPGQHTVRFFLKFSAPNDCLTVDEFRAEGPFVTLGPGGAYWSSVQSFRIRQTGI